MNKGTRIAWGHMWNHFIGIASPVAQILNPSPRHTDPSHKLRSREIYLWVLTRKREPLQEIAEKYRLQTETLTEGEVEAVEKLERLVRRINRLLASLREAVSSLQVEEVAQDSPGVPKNFRVRLTEEATPQVLQFVEQLKAVLVEVNELLYEQRCEFFDS